MFATKAEEARYLTGLVTEALDGESYTTTDVVVGNFLKIELTITLEGDNNV